ncbi:MAG: hypothetical protein J7K04_00665 [Spirochaetales bacterium]|nr:hypothetical protein [Spirochaetales bacterium]
MDNVISVVKRSNQRGGRMLSVADLLEAGTLDLDKAGWLISRIEEGSSFLVGAKPGGAGKTTVMGALLVMLPAGVRLYLTDRSAGGFSAEMSASNNSYAKKYIVSYEISPAFYEGYVWGKALRDMFAKTELGFRIAANLHADTVEDAKYQIVTENRVPEYQFNKCGIFVPITLRGWNREIKRIFYFDKERDNRWKELNAEREVSEREAEIQDFLKYCVKRDIRLIEEVRDEWLAWSSGRPPI